MANGEPIEFVSAVPLCNAWCEDLDVRHELGADAVTRWRAARGSREP